MLAGGSLASIIIAKRVNTMFTKNKITTLTSDYAGQLETIKEWVNSADAIVVGIGSGLSAAGGLDYTTPALAEKWYPEYYKLGCRSLFDIMGLYWVTTVTEQSATKYWGFWAWHIWNIRYQTEATEPYTGLAALLDGKNYFIVTTNADGQTQKVFPADKIFAPQGNYCYFQCKKPCSDEIYYNEDMVRTMVENIPNPFEIRSEDIPRCPKCGELLIPNLRCDFDFVEAPHLKTMPDYERFIEENQNKRLVLLELGVGFNTPMIIRYPFEAMTNEFPDTRLVRINNTIAEVPREIKSKSIVISECLSKVTSDWRKI